MKNKLFAAALVAGMLMAGCSSSQSTEDKSTAANEQTSETETTDNASEQTANNETTAAFKDNGFDVTDYVAQDNQETFKFTKDGDTGTVTVYKFDDNNLAITKWNDAQTEVENNGYEIQTQDSAAYGSTNIYYNSSDEKYCIFVMNADTTAVYEINDVTAATLSNVKDALKTLGLSA